MPLGWLYGRLMRLRNLSYDQGWRKRYQAPVPVISVGNLSMGGTGKTPMAEYLLQHWNPVGQGSLAYLSRGYGRQSKGFIAIDSQASARQVGDEALQVARKFPGVRVAVCESRTEGIRQLLTLGPLRGIVLDDAFQHRKVHRTLDIVMIDAQRPPHRDAVLPAGSLREALASLARADVLVCNRVENTDDRDALRQIYHSWGKPMLFCRPALTSWQGFGESDSRPLTELAGRRAVVFSGIGNHRAFVAAVQQLGIEVVYERGFRDHHHYRETELRELAQRCPSEGLLLTTEKDYCRLKGLVPAGPWAYLPMTLDWWEGSDWGAFERLLP